MISVSLRYSVENIADQIVTYNTLRLYSGNSPVTTMVTIADSEPLVAGVVNYDLVDTAGTANTWYRVRLHHTGTLADSDFSPPFQPDATTLLKIRIEAARRCHAGFESVCSAVGDPAYLVDAVLGDSALTSKVNEGNWIYRPDAALAADMLRRVNIDGWTVGTSRLAPSRSWTNAPANGERYQLFALFPPTDTPGDTWSWDRAVRDGLQMCPYEDQIEIGTGTSTGQTRFPLDAFPQITQETYRGCILRTEDSNGLITEINGKMNGREAVVRDNGLTSSYLDMRPAPNTTETIIVKVKAFDRQLYADTDTTNVPLELAARAASLAAMRQMFSRQPDRYKNEVLAANGDFRSLYQAWGRRAKPHVEL